MKMVLYALFEHAAGYATFKVNSNEEIGALLPQVQEAVVDLERFGRIIKLIAFTPFRNAANALENMNSISEGQLQDVIPGGYSIQEALYQKMI